MSIDVDSLAVALSVALHLVAALIWVGGMFFAHQILRPIAAAQLEPSQRLPLWLGCFQRFFVWVWIAVLLLPLTGYGLIFGKFGGMGAVGLHIHLMSALGLLMIAIYLYLYLFPYRRLQQAVTQQMWAEGKGALDRIRMLVGINLLLGLVTAAIAAAGRWLPL